MPASLHYPNTVDAGKQAKTSSVWLRQDKV
jgi:hypothetical protein